MWYNNIAGTFFGLVTKYACDRRTDRRTDRQTNRQNYDSQDRASIAASRGKNQLKLNPGSVASYDLRSENGAVRDR